jgi:hypothetical protein
LGLKKKIVCCLNIYRVQNEYFEVQKTKSWFFDWFGYASIEGRTQMEELGE